MLERHNLDVRRIAVGVGVSESLSIPLSHMWMKQTELWERMSGGWSFGRMASLAELSEGAGSIGGG